VNSCSNWPVREFTDRELNDPAICICCARVSEWVEFNAPLDTIQVISVAEYVVRVYRTEETAKNDRTECRLFFISDRIGVFKWSAVGGPLRIFRRSFPAATASDATGLGARLRWRHRRTVVSLRRHELATTRPPHQTRSHFLTMLSCSVIRQHTVRLTFTKKVDSGHFFVVRCRRR